MALRNLVVGWRAAHSEALGRQGTDGMHWLPWLDSKQAALVRKRIDATVAQEICHRHWGAHAPGPSPGGIPRLYIMDIRGLLLASGVLRYTLAPFGTSVFYRGQSKDWVAQVSLMRGTSSRAETKARLKWLDQSLAAVAKVFDPAGTPDAREALLQHYGLPTRWLDVVDNIQTAAWFAHHQRAISADAPGARDDASGYIAAIACPSNGVKFAQAFDLRAKPSEWLRPHVQQAWAVRSLSAATRLGRLEHLQVATFIVPRTLLRLWSSYDVIGPEVMFPREREDKGMYYWRRACEVLEANKLWPAPWA